LIGVMGENHVAVVDWRARQVVKNIPTGSGAHNLAPRGDGRHFFVSNRVENTISVIDAGRLEVVRTYKVPGGPDCMALSPGGRELWITSRWIMKVSVLDLETGKVVRQYPVGRSPHGIFYARSAPSAGANQAKSQ